MSLTYGQARAMSIWRWKNHPTGFPVDYEWKAYFSSVGLDFKPTVSWRVVPWNHCGFCEYYDTCESCPLKWNKPAKERYSRYRSWALPCSRNVWHWSYWIQVIKFRDELGESSANSKKRVRYWAKKMLFEIEATPKHGGVFRYYKGWK